MKSFFRFLFVLFVAAGIAAVVASVVSKKKLMAMSDDEIREFLGSKLEGRVGEEQLGKIQDAVVSKVRGTRPDTQHYTDESDEVGGSESEADSSGDEEPSNDDESSDAEKSSNDE